MSDAPPSRLSKSLSLGEACYVPPHALLSGQWTDGEMEAHCPGLARLSARGGRDRHAVTVHRATVGA